MRSSTTALKLSVVIFIPACAVFMSLPEYLHGPPEAWQSCSTRWVLNLESRAGSATVAAKKLLTRVSALIRVTKSLTTAVIPFLPPRRTYSDFSLAVEVPLASAITGMASATTSITTAIRRRLANELMQFLLEVLGILSSTPRHRFSL